jgi:hypothetical protein
MVTALYGNNSKVIIACEYLGAGKGKKHFSSLENAMDV